MPYGDPDPQDPNVLIGVAIPADRDAVREMAYTFAEEFAAMGFGEARLMKLFREPFYTGPHRAYRILGEEAIGAIVAETVASWGRLRAVVREPEGEGEPERLVEIGGGFRQGRARQPQAGEEE